MIVSSIIAPRGIGLAYVFYGGGYREPAKKFAAAFPGFVRLVRDKFRVDELYDKLFVRPIKLIGDGIFYVVDRILIDRILVGGPAALTSFLARIPRWFQNGDGQGYMAWFAIGAAVLVYFSTRPALSGDLRIATTRPRRRRSTPAAAPRRRSSRSSTSSTSTTTASPRSRARRSQAHHTYARPGSYKLRITVRNPAWGTKRTEVTPDRGAVMSGGLGILGWVTLLPLFGAGLVMLVPREEESIHRGLGLFTSIVTFLVSLLILNDFDSSQAGFQLEVNKVVDRAPRHPLPPGRRRHLAVARAAHDVPRAAHAAVAAGHRHPQHPRARVHDRDARARDRHAGRLRRARPVRLLRLLGADAHPDVLHHRDLGRRAAPLRGHQVRHLHARGLAAHARRDPVTSTCSSRRPRATSASTTRICRT